jgi:hypothetical protein
MSTTFNKPTSGKGNTDITLDQLDRLLVAVKDKYVVCGLLLGSNTVGYKVIYNLTRLVEGKQATWSFDISMNNLTVQQKKVMQLASRMNLQLVPYKGVYVTKLELEDGVFSVDLDGRRAEIDMIVDATLSPRVDSDPTLLGTRLNNVKRHR